jgi:hypothetical protein
MSEYAASSVKKEKVINLTPDAMTGELFTFEDASATEGTDQDNPVEELARERAAYEQVLRGQGRTEERIRYLLGQKFGLRIARLAINHDVTRLLPPEPRAGYEKPAVYRDARSAAANDRLDD